MNKFDVIVIGAGSGGLTAAITLASTGRKVLLVERDKIGGECTHSGCIPSKALLHAAKEGKDSKSALKYTRDVIEKIYQEESPEKIRKHGITVIEGEAEFLDKCSIKIRNETYHFKKAVISTGSSPRQLDIEGLQKEDVLDNQNIFNLESAPEKLLVIGSGPIGMEMSQAFSKLGSKVTVATIDNRFASLEDPAVSKVLEKQFEKDGVNIILNAHIKKVEGKEAIFEIKENEEVKDIIRISFDKVLIAVGRVPNIPKGLAKANIKYSKHGIKITHHYKTSNRSVYAIGDVSLRLKFTHTANEAGRHVSKKIIAPFLYSRTSKNIPKVTYTNPEVSAVGISYKEAMKKYGEKFVIKIEVPFENLDRAKTDNNINGLAVVVAKKISGQILGANIVGKRAGELISVFTLAMDRKISLFKINKTVFPYPTYSEIIKKVSDVFFISALRNSKENFLNLFKKNVVKLIGLLFWTGIIFWFYKFKMENGYTFQDMFIMMYHFVTGTTWGPIIYILAYTIRPLIFFPATLMTMLSGALFGLPIGILYTIIGENGSANLAYFIGRFFGKDSKLEDSPLVGHWVMKLRKEPFISVLIMRFIYLPFDLVNYATGILQVKWKAYALATLIGIIPGLTTFVGFGASLQGALEDATTTGSSLDLTSIQPDIKVLAFSIVLFITSLVLARYFKKKYVNK